MDLDDFIVATYCLIDDRIRAGAPASLFATRGPTSALSPSEVLTVVTVGEYWGLDQDQTIFRYFRRHSGAWFPALGRIHRPTFGRQAANLWGLAAWVWQQIGGRLWQREPAIIDSFPMPVCPFARASRCRRFAGLAAYGKDTLVRQTFYGFRVHIRLVWPGIVRQIALMPANVSEQEGAALLASGTSGLLIGDRNYHAPLLQEDLATMGVRLVAPYRWASRDPDPAGSTALSRVRYRLETVVDQRVERYHTKKVWARDWWHLCGRLLRKVLSHTIALYFTAKQGGQPLQLARLLAN